MSHKTEEAYVDVLEFIKNSVLDLTCLQFSSDYEYALRKALLKVYPASLSVASWFHFCQAVRRFASQISGFVSLLESNDEIAEIFRKLLCLPLLPHMYIVSTFDELKTAAVNLNNNVLLTFLAYYKRQWLIRVSLSKENINYYEMIMTFWQTIGRTNKYYCLWT